MEASQAVFDSQQYILGPKVEEFEEKMAQYCGCKYAVGVSSGTDALLLSLMAAGIGEGDYVITTPYTFFATAGSISRVGATPVFVDIDVRTYNIDPVKVADLINSLDGEKKARLRAIIPVHLYGQCADMEPILDIADKFDLKVIEDAAQAIGAEYQFSDGSIKRAGSMGHYGCFSFYPSKNLGAFGEGGMVTTNEEEVYLRLKTFRHHGDVGRYSHKFIGGNFRMDAVQAALLLVKLKYLDEWTNKRIEHAELYRQLLDSAHLDMVSAPYLKEFRHVYHQFIIKIHGGDRDKLQEFMGLEGVGCGVYYPAPLHLQECFSYLGYSEDAFPVSMCSSMNTLALPIYSELTEEQLVYVIETIKKYYDIK
jgi:dTDP-4-amino-4,6-dideoxygalactose transaminase